MLGACRSTEVDRPPVWLMRQAGRYLPEYRELRALHSFWEMVKTPALAAEVSLQPVRRFSVDAAILFSDILVVPDALGIDVRYEEGGPVLRPHVRTAEGMQTLKEAVPEGSFGYVAEAVERLCRELHPQFPVIGFAGAPFTLAAYMVQGGPSRDVTELKILAGRDPGLYDALARRIADAVTGLLRVQVKAGADVLQIFDTWAAHLSPQDYEELALPYTRRVIEGIADLQVPVILYVRNAAGLLEQAGASGCQVLSVDSSLRLSDARARLDAGVALQGNFDPALLFASPERIRSAVRAGLHAARGGGYIVNLGHGVVPGTPVEGVDAFVKAVTEGGS
jgi:uroporphyrinogen decarboxylase